MLRPTLRHGHDNTVQILGARSARKRQGNLRRCSTEIAGVLPDCHRLLTFRDPVQRCGLTVLPGECHAVEPLGLQGRGGAARHPVVHRHDGIDGVVVGGKNLVHGSLSSIRAPVLDVLLCNDTDFPCIDLGLQYLHLALAEDIHDGMSRVPFDQCPVSIRLRFHHRFGHQAPHGDVVEAHEYRVRIIDWCIVGDHGNSLLFRHLESRQDRVGILCQDDQGIDPGGDEAFDIRQLLDWVGLRVRADVGMTRRVQHTANTGLVNLPALFLEVAPTDADSVFLGSHQIGRKYRSARDHRGADCLNSSETSHLTPPH